METETVPDLIMVRLDAVPPVPADANTLADARAEANSWSPNTKRAYVTGPDGKTSQSGAWRAGASRCRWLRPTSAGTWSTQWRRRAGCWPPLTRAWHCCRGECDPARCRRHYETSGCEHYRYTEAPTLALYNTAVQKATSVAPPAITGEHPIDVPQFEDVSLADYPEVGWGNDGMACTIRNAADRDAALAILQEEVRFNELAHADASYGLVGPK